MQRPSYFKWFFLFRSASQLRVQITVLLIGCHISKIVEPYYVEHSSTASLFALGLAFVWLTIGYFADFKKKWSNGVIAMEVTNNV